MGFQSGSVCYSTALQAADHARWDMGHLKVTTVANGQSIGLWIEPWESGGAMNLITDVWNLSTDTQLYHSVDPVTFPNCGVNDLTVMDGVQIGWMVGAAWVAAFCVMFIARALRGETGGNYGSA